MIVGINNIEVGAIRGNSFWIWKTSWCARTVCKSCGSWACKCCYFSSWYYYLANPVIVMISNIKVCTVSGYALGSIKSCCWAGTVCKTKDIWACFWTSKGRYNSWWNYYLAYIVIPHINNIKICTVAGHTKRNLKFCRWAGTVWITWGSRRASQGRYYSCGYHYLADRIICTIWHIEVCTVSRDWSRYIKTCCCASAVRKSCSSWTCKCSHFRIIRILVCCR